jgi:hypothetical protein
MSFFFKIAAFLLAFSLAAEKMTVVFINRLDVTEMMANDDAKKSGMEEEESDNSKKTEDPDKFYSNSYPNIAGISLITLFTPGNTPLHVHPYCENDTKPPKS